MEHEVWNVVEMYSAKLTQKVREMNQQWADKVEGMEYKGQKREFDKFVSDALEVGLDKDAAKLAGVDLNAGVVPYAMQMGKLQVVEGKDHCLRMQSLLQLKKISKFHKLASCSIEFSSTW